MQYDGEAREFLHNGVENVESQGRRYQTTRSGVYVALLGFELVGTVRSTDRDSQRVATRAVCEVDNLFGVGVGVVFGRNLILNTGENAQLTFNGYIELVCIVNYFFREGYILFVRQVRTVDHHRRETCVDTRFAQFERIAVVEVQHDLRMFATQLFGVFYGALCHITEQRLVGIITSAFRYLQNHRRFRFYGCLDNCLHLFHVVEVESRDSISAFDSLGKHLSGVYQS